MDKKEVVSLIELAHRFAKAKNLGDKGYQWLRKAPGRSARKDEMVGNSLAVLKAVRSFNTGASKPIEVFAARGYDGTPKQVMVIAKPDIIRLKGYILRSGTRKRAPKRSSTPFKIVSKVEV
jgi:hypothetical protein